MSTLAIVAQTVAATQQHYYPGNVQKASQESREYRWGRVESMGGALVDDLRTYVVLAATGSVFKIQARVLRNETLKACFVQSILS